MHILMTADTVGGVWTYTRELVTQLSRRGIQITLVSFGQIPVPEQLDWMEGLSEVSYHPTAFRLEWMQDPQADLDQSAELLRSIIQETRPDVLHFNQFYYGAIDCSVPRIVVAHSDVVSWWVAVHGAEPPASEWIDLYRKNVARGLEGADLVVAPSRWMVERVAQHYGPQSNSTVVYNGRDPELFKPYKTKEDFAISIGRLWDAGKQACLLLRDDLPLKTILVGSEQSPEGVIAVAQSSGRLPNLHMYGPQSEAQLRELLAGASMYLATSRYEPFGLAPLEAALSGCPLIANDIPTFREIWGDEAIYFERNHSQKLQLAIQELASNPERRAEFGARALERARTHFNSDRMAEDYLRMYRSLLSAEVAAA